MSIDLNIINNENLKPRPEVRIEKLHAEPYPDGQRVKVTVTITPFRERPNLEIALHDASDRRIANASIIEVMAFSITLTMHLRGVQNPSGDYTVRGELYYEDVQHPQDQQTSAFTIALPG